MHTCHLCIDKEHRHPDKTQLSAHMLCPCQCQTHNTRYTRDAGYTRVQDEHRCLHASCATNTMLLSMAHYHVCPSVYAMACMHATVVTVWVRQQCGSVATNLKEVPQLQSSKVLQVVIPSQGVIHVLHNRQSSRRQSKTFQCQMGGYYATMGHLMPEKF